MDSNHDPLISDIPSRYKVKGRLGVGGMGAVYEAHDSYLDKKVAIKVLRGGTGAPAALSGLQREAQ